MYFSQTPWHILMPIGYTTRSADIPMYDVPFQSGNVMHCHIICHWTIVTDAFTPAAFRLTYLKCHH
jgi:hypothetical protein